MLMYAGGLLLSC